eukprot:GEMP01047055.1.p1 GENE.GEMP01047055.1~~GEMP01047055.1.p1  ORF type:complete len:395 (+),score=55.25 GEMP01047055.1:93-1277(+)
MLDTMYPDMSQQQQMPQTMYPEPVARIGRGRAMPPCKVLLIRSFDAPEHYLQRTLVSIAQAHNPMVTELPMFQQLEKGITFVQFPSIECAGQAMEYINQGTMQTPMGKNIHSEFSSRAEVVSRKRPVPPCQFLSFDAPAAKRLDARDCCSTLSPVLCVKTDMTEDELRSFMVPCQAMLIDVLYVHNKNMTFLEFANVDDSTRALLYINSSGYVSPNGVQIDAMYSNRMKIERSDVRRPEVVEPSRCNEFQSQTVIHRNAYSHFNQNQRGSTDNIPHQVELPPTEQGELAPNRIVIVTLRTSQQIMPPTVDYLMVPFSHCGIVEKILVFSKSTEYCQALVQYATIDFARLAMERFQGLILGDYQLEIHFSDRNNLDVAKNSDRARDFTNPWLPEA